jgi:hypothetical protein
MEQRKEDIKSLIDKVNKMSEEEFTGVPQAFMEMYIKAVQAILKETKEG